MADILERVQKARQHALLTYLKEYTTHKLAVFISKAENELIAALDDIVPGIITTLQNPEHRARIYNNAIHDICSIDRVHGQHRDPSVDYSPGDELFSRFHARLKQGDKHILNDFNDLVLHLRRAQIVVAQTSQKANPTLTEMNQSQTITQHLEGMFGESVERAEQMTQRLEYDLEHGHRRQPEVLILQGGGAKGMAYSGIVEVLEDTGLLKGIKRVGGTSAGALMGLPIALGYSAGEIHEIVKHSRFAQFYAESTVKFKAVTKLVDAISSKSLDEHQWHEGNMLSKFASKFLLPELAHHSQESVKTWTHWGDSRVQQDLRLIEEGKHPTCKMSLQEIYDIAMGKFNKYLHSKKIAQGALGFHDLLGRSEAFQAALTCVRVKRPYALENSDSVEDFIGDIIQERLKQVSNAHLERLDPPIRTLTEMRNITFTQLKALGEMNPDYGFKEFGVAVTDSYYPVTPGNLKRKLTRDKEFTVAREPDPGTGDYDNGGDFKPVFVRASSEHHSYIDMPIKKAVRASMNLPFVFQAMKVDNMRLVDGGLTTNFPHKMFADAYETQEQVRENTIGFMLSALEDNIENEALQELARNGTTPVGIDVHFEPERFSRKLSKIKDGILHPFASMKSGAGAVMGSLASSAIKNLMRANYMPSLETMENIGLINTGTVGTGDFHASVSERDKLHTAGVQAAHGLLCWDADKHLRFAMGRLISLATIENKLLEERGLTPNFNLPSQALMDADVLTASLTDGRYDDWNLGSVLLGRILPTPPKTTTMRRKIEEAYTWN